MLLEKLHHLSGMLRGLPRTKRKQRRLQLWQRRPRAAPFSMSRGPTTHEQKLQQLHMRDLQVGSLMWAHARQTSRPAVQSLLPQHWMLPAALMRRRSSKICTAWLQALRLPPTQLMPRRVPAPMFWGAQLAVVLPITVLFRRWWQQSVGRLLRWLQRLSELVCALQPIDEG